MSVPKKKRTLSSKKRRASHFSLGKKNLTSCKKCGKAVLPHTACSFCGAYAGKQVISPKTKKTSKKAEK